MKIRIIGKLGTLVIASCALVVPANAELRRTGAAAQTGAFGLEAVYTGARQKNILGRQLPGDQERVIVSFLIRPETGFTFQGGGKNNILLLRSANQTIVRGFLKKKGSRFQLRFKVRDGSRLRKVKKKIDLPLGDAAIVAVDWGAAQNPEAQNGSLRVRMNDNIFFILLTDLDNGDQTVDNLRFGQISSPPSGWNGRISFDAFRVRRP